MAGCVARRSCRPPYSSEISDAYTEVGILTRVMFCIFPHRRLTSPDPASAAARRCVTQVCTGSRTGCRSTKTILTRDAAILGGKAGASSKRRASIGRRRDGQAEAAARSVKADAQIKIRPGPLAISCRTRRNWMDNEWRGQPEPMPQ